MRLLVIEPHGDGLLDLAMRAKDAGHVVRHFCGDRAATSPRPIGRGLIDCVSDWRGSMGWADLVLLGSHKFMAEIDAWHAQGVPIIGAGAAAAEWELDRLVGMEAFKHAGIPVPPFRHVASLDEAIAYTVKRGEGMAVKPSGDVTDKSLSVVAKNDDPKIATKELLYTLGNWKREGKKFPKGLILQDRIDGVEMAVGAWVGPEGFAEGWEENFEEKRLFAGGIGPNCGEAGTVTRLVKTSKLANKVLAPLEDRLVSLGYVGNVDVNCIIDHEGNPWPLEFTMRFGYPAINIEVALYDGDPIEYFAGLAAGKPPNTRRLNDVAVGVVVALPPYPFGNEKAEEVVGVPIWGKTHDGLHFCNAMMGEAPDEAGKKEPQLCTAGSYVLVATGTGPSVVAARAAAHRVIDRLTIPASPFHRNDIGSRLRRGLDDLARHGFAKGMNYA